jgi:LuxR family maltose regulon positive regulatory protein
VLGTVGLAGAAANACDFRTTLARADEALLRATHSTTQNQNGSRAIAHSFASWASLELLDTASARDHATVALEFAAKQPDETVRVQVQHAYNDAWFEALDQKRRVAQEFVTAWPPQYLRGASHTSIVASLFSGLRMATHLNERRWSERLLNTGRQMLGERFDWQVAYCLYLISIGRHDSARTVLGPLMGEPHPDAVPISEIVAWSMDAVLESRANNPYRAHSSIYRALERADETGAYYEVGRVGMRAVAQILAAGSGRFGPHEHVARSLLAEDVGGGGALDSGELTYRERQILGELRTLRTVDEIAHDLLLSVNTVKTHMRGIYRKLGVSSRRQAIAKAERFGLL